MRRVRVWPRPTGKLNFQLPAGPSAAGARAGASRAAARPRAAKRFMGRPFGKSVHHGGTEGTEKSRKRFVLGLLRALRASVVNVFFHDRSRSEVRYVLGN